MNGGEIFLVAFVTVAVVSARYWPALGERIAVRLGGGQSKSEARASSESQAGGAPRE